MQLDDSVVSRGVGIGTSTVQGQAFLKDMAGDVKFAAGDLIQLCPAPLGKYLLEVAQLRDDENPPYTLVEYDHRVDTACRVMKGDGQGHFRFAGVAPGKYELAAWIVWSYNAGNTVVGWVSNKTLFSLAFANIQRTGGLVTAEASVGENETADVIVNEVALPPP